MLFNIIGKSENSRVIEQVCCIQSDFDGTSVVVIAILMGMHLDRKSQERNVWLWKSSKLNDKQFLLGPRVIVETSIEIDKLDVNFCQSRDFYFTHFYFILYIDVTHWGITIGVVPVKIASDDSITCVSDKIHKNFVFLKIGKIYLKSFYY